MRILFVEDDKDLCQALLIHFKSQGYDTDICNNGTDGLFYALQNVYDLMILDRMLPELDGLTLLNTIRKRGIQTPVILATAMDTLDDKIHGLDEGLMITLPNPLLQKSFWHVSGPLPEDPGSFRLPDSLSGKTSPLILRNWSFPVGKILFPCPKRNPVLWNIS